jgi:hypothetical protein
MRDTTPEAEQVRLAAIRRMEPALRVRQALMLSESVRRLALSRLAEAHPGHSEIELVELLLGMSLRPVGVRPPVS